MYTEQDGLDYLDNSNVDIELLEQFANFSAIMGGVTAGTPYSMPFSVVGFGTQFVIELSRNLEDNQKFDIAVKDAITDAVVHSVVGFVEGVAVRKVTTAVAVGMLNASVSPGSIALSFLVGEGVPLGVSAGLINTTPGFDREGFEEKVSNNVQDFIANPTATAQKLYESGAQTLMEITKTASDKLTVILQAGEDNAETDDDLAAAAFAGVVSGGGTPKSVQVELFEEPIKTYVVGKGDTVWGIADRYGTTQEALLAANPNLTVETHNGVDFVLIKPGEILVLPDEAATTDNGNLFGESGTQDVNSDLQNVINTYKSYTSSGIEAYSKGSYLSYYNGMHLYIGGVLITTVLPEPEWAEWEAISASPRYLYGDPLVLDLDGDGVETLSTTAGVYFDTLNTGNMTFQTGWAGADDGMLAIDLNSNGIIDDAEELFQTQNSGPLTTLLATYDTDTNNILNSSDTLWSSLRVWKDANSNGVTDDGELLTLGELLITSINLTGSANGTVVNGNTIDTDLTFVMDGNTEDAAAITFGSDTSNSQYTSEYDLKLETLFLPQARGYGMLPNLHIAMSVDDDLLDMVRDFTELTTADAADMKAAVQDILLRWADVDGDDDDINGAEVDSRIVHFMNKFAGVVPTLTDNLTYDSGPAGNMKNQFSEVLEHYTLLLAAQGPLAELFPDATYSFTDDALDLGVTDLEDVMAAAEDVAPEDATDAAYFWALVRNVLSTDDSIAAADLTAAIGAELMALSVPAAGSFTEPVINNGGDVLIGTTGADTMHGDGGDDVVFAQGGTNTVYGGDGNDILIGGAGDETLSGDAGDDLICGLAGNDSISGQAGNDVIYGGDGNDIVTSGDDDDALYGEVGIDTLYGGNGNDTLDGGADTDSLYAGAGDDTLIGGVGNDSLFGDSTGSGDSNPTASGDDILIGGTGDDYMAGNKGSDTYIFNLGDGHDTVDEIYSDGSSVDSIVFGEGIAPEDVTFQSTGGDLKVLINGGSSDSILIKNWFSGGSLEERIEQFVFADETVLTASDATTDATSVTGTTGNDTLYGTPFADTIDGLAGNDSIHGQTGDDTLYGGDGNDFVYGDAGTDILYGGAGNDVLSGGDDVDSLYGEAGQDTLYGGNGNDTLDGGADTDFLYAGAGDDTLYGGDGDDVLSGDGTSGSDYNSSSNVGNDTLYGGAGNDNIYANKGDDILVGGTGTDNLRGGDGSDSYVFSSGDGTDTITDQIVSSDVNTVSFADVDSSDVTLSQSSNNLWITYGSDKVIVSSWYTDNSYRMDSISFADDVTITTAEAESAITGNSGSLVLTVNGTSSNNTITGTGRAEIINALAGADTVHAGGSNDTIYGGDGNDNLYGEAGRDTLYGEAGNDDLYGGDGNDILDGGAGTNDYLRGEAGSDTYLFNVGNETDTVIDSYEAGKTNTVVFGAGIYKADLKLYRASATSANLVIENTVTGDKLIINDWNSTDKPIQAFTFTESGQSLSVAEATVGYNTIYGTASNNTIVGDAADNTIYALDGNDTLYGAEGNDILYGGNGGDYLYSDRNGSGTDVGSGDDQLYGGDSGDQLYAGAGDDILDGGLGNDTLRGEGGSDTYYYNTSTGTDIVIDAYEAGETNTVVFGAGIYKTDLKLYRQSESSANLVIENTTTGDKLQINSWNATDKPIQAFEFTESGQGGLTVGEATVGYNTIYGATSGAINGDAADNIIYGGSGNNQIYSGAGNDILYGGDGNDNLQGDTDNTLTIMGNGDDTFYGGAGSDGLYGEGGSDTYHFERGDGTDTIHETTATNSDTDKAIFGADVDFDQLWFWHSSSDLKAKIIGTSDVLTFQSWYSDSDTQVEELYSGDGMVMLKADVETLVQAMAGYSVPTGSDTEMDSGIRSALDTTLTAVWQEAA